MRVSEMVETKKAKLLRGIIEKIAYHLKLSGQNVIDYELHHFEANDAHVWVVIEKDSERWLEMWAGSYQKDDWYFNEYCELEGIMDFSCPMRLLELTPKSINPYYESYWRKLVTKFWKEEQL
jgi:hypothetical protein